jgi:hypothetical protein
MDSRRVRGWLRVERFDNRSRRGSPSPTHAWITDLGRCSLPGKPAWRRCHEVPEAETLLHPVDEQPRRRQAAPMAARAHPPVNAACT